MVLEIVESKKGHLLSDAYLGYSIHMKCKCVLGHIWDVTPSSLMGGSWCIKCNKIEERLPKRPLYYIPISTKPPILPYGDDLGYTYMEVVNWG
jgi:hypothetical protein